MIYVIHYSLSLLLFLAGIISFIVTNEYFLMREKNIKDKETYKLKTRKYAKKSILSGLIIFIIKTIQLVFT